MCGDGSKMTEPIRSTREEDGGKVNKYQQVGRLTQLNGHPYLTKSQSPYVAVR